MTQDRKSGDKEMYRDPDMTQEKWEATDGRNADPAMQARFIESGTAAEVDEFLAAPGAGISRERPGTEAFPDWSRAFFGGTLGTNCCPHPLSADPEPKGEPEPEGEPMWRRRMLGKADDLLTEARRMVQADRGNDSVHLVNIAHAYISMAR